MPASSSTTSTSGPITVESGVFEDVSLLAGCAFNGAGVAGSGMGVHAVDLDDDGDLDVFVSQLRRQGHALYINKGGWFDDETSRFGIFAPSLPYTGFGTGFCDFDHDGDLDLFVTNGRVTLARPIPDPADPYAEEDFLMGAANAIDSSMALDKAHWVPGKIEVDYVAALLEVHTLRQHVGA